MFGTSSRRERIDYKQYCFNLFIYLFQYEIPEKIYIDLSNCYFYCLVSVHRFLITTKIIRVHTVCTSQIERERKKKLASEYSEGL